MVGLSFEGTGALADALRSLPQALRKDTVREALREAAEPIRSDVARSAPRGPDAPHLGEHIVIANLRSYQGVRLSETEVAVGIGPSKEFFYGLFWEFGWRFRRTPHPFVRPAYERGKARALRDIGAALWRALRGRSASFRGV